MLAPLIQLSDCWAKINPAETAAVFGAVVPSNPPRPGLAFFHSTFLWSCVTELSESFHRAFNMSGHLPSNLAA
jgi:hypothetical protein